jgi:hypothetical protein
MEQILASRVGIGYKVDDCDAQKRAGAVLGGGIRSEGCPQRHVPLSNDFDSLLKHETTN